MPFRSVQKIEAKRTQALRGRLLQTSATDFVKAEWQWGRPDVSSQDAAQGRLD